jgi:glycosyltransferase involved in cell wall biosynthesis
LQNNSANKNRPLVIYTGTVSPDRGLLTPIKSTFHFDNLGIHPLILIIGDGSYKSFLTNYVNNNNLDSYIRFLDWPGHEEILFYIQKARVCMIPQPNNEFINTTIPHKLFEYMFMEKPVLVSDAIPLKRIVEETNSGLVFKSSNPLDFATKLKILLESQIEWGNNGKKAILDKYNWKRDSKELLKLYNSYNFE